MYSKKHCKKLEAKGSRLSFSFSSDFIVILQPVRITVFGKVCKRYEKTKKIISRQKPRNRNCTTMGPKTITLVHPETLQLFQGSLNQYIMFPSVFVFHHFSAANKSHSRLKNITKPPKIQVIYFQR